MGLRIGNKNVKEMNLGNRRVVGVFLGNKAIYQEATEYGYASSISEEDLIDIVNEYLEL